MLFVLLIKIYDASVSSVISSLAKGSGRRTNVRVVLKYRSLHGQFVQVGIQQGMDSLWQTTISAFVADSRAVHLSGPGICRVKG